MPKGTYRSMQRLAHTGRNIPVFDIYKSFRSMLRQMILKKKKTAFRFIWRVFTYFKFLYNPCSSKLKGEGGESHCNSLFFLIKKIKHVISSHLALIVLKYSLCVSFQRILLSNSKQKAKYQKLAQGTLYKIKYHNANKATASIRSDDSEEDKFRMVLSKWPLGAKCNKTGEGYIPKVSLKKDRQNIINKCLLFEAVGPLVSLMLNFRNLALVWPSIPG